jgi:hypothetical protein
MGRKTIEVERLVEMVNDVLQQSAEDQKGIRQGMINMLESVLFETKNYKGFRYLNQNEVNTPYPGIWLNEDGSHNYPACFEHTDATRVRY